jgi:hypothetical protein
MTTEAETEAKARELYEASRKDISGRPCWAQLDLNDPYDMGMKHAAITKARLALNQIDDLLRTSRAEATLEHLRKMVEVGDRLSHGSPDRNAIEDIIAEARQIIA